MSTALGCQMSYASFVQMSAKLICQKTCSPPGCQFLIFAASWSTWNGLTLGEFSVVFIPTQPYWITSVCCSQNLLDLPENIREFSFPNIKFLICGSMGLKWTDVLNLSWIFPNVNELRVTSNRISNLDTPENCFQSLKLLDLEGNGLHDWNEICKLSTLPTLEHLNLENTGIKTIRLSSNMFKAIMKLVLSGNSIEDVCFWLQLASNLFADFSFVLVAIYKRIEQAQILRRFAVSQKSGTLKSDVCHVRSTNCSTNKKLKGLYSGRWLNEFKRNLF